MCRQLEKYLAKGWTKLSVSPYGAPVYFVHKMEGKLQMCIDFRMVNKQTTNYAYPISQIDEILDFLCKARDFLIIDLSKAYHQVAIEPPHLHKVAFLMKYRLFEFLVLPFRMVNC